MNIIKDTNKHNIQNNSNNIFYKTKKIKNNLLDTLKPANDFEFFFHESLPELYKQYYREPLHIIIHKIKEQEPNTYKEIEHKLIVGIQKILKEKYKYERIPFTEENKEPNIVGYSTLIYLLQNNKKNKIYKGEITTMAEYLSQEKFNTAEPLQKLIEELAYNIADNIVIKEYEEKTKDQINIIKNVIKILPNIDKKKIIKKIYQKTIQETKSGETAFINNYMTNLLHTLGEKDGLFEIRDFRTIKKYLPEDINEAYFFAKKYNFISKYGFHINGIANGAYEELTILLSNFLSNNPQEKDKEYISKIIDYIKQQQENIEPKTQALYLIIRELLDQKCFSLEKIEDRFQRRTKINSIYIRNDFIKSKVSDYDEIFDLFFLIQRTMKYDHTKEEFIDNVYKEQKDYKQIVDFLRYPKLYEYKNLREKKKTFEIEKIQDELFLVLLKNNIIVLLPNLPEELKDINERNNKIYNKIKKIPRELISITYEYGNVSDEFVNIAKDDKTTTEDIHNYIFEKVLENDPTRLLNQTFTKGLTINQNFQQILTKIDTLFPEGYYTSKACGSTIYIKDFEKSKGFSIIDVLQLPNEEIISLLKKNLIYQDPKFTISTFSEINKKLNFSKSEILELYIAGIREDKGTYNPGFPINKENFLEYLDDNDVLLDIEKDRNLIKNPIPRTKQWFLENPERKNYLNKDIIGTFLKFGTNIAIAILEGTKSKELFNKFYLEKFKTINRSNERSTILQLGEVFSLIIAKNNYEFFDTLVNQEIPLGEILRNFIENNTIGEKGKTISVLLFTSELNKVYQSGLNIDVTNICQRVYQKLTSYDKIVNIYKNIPEGLKTSIGLEYEVTTSIANAYKNRTNSQYKPDIEILSAYSGIAKGNDAVHEIATRPSDNPYLLILELKLLHELDFIDLNFEHDEYNKGSRSYHATVGGEYGIQYDDTANLLQNTLVMSNLGGINTGKNVSKVNRYSNIRDKGSDCEAIFGKKTPTTEFRSFTIDTAESFERTIVSLFNLSIGKQAIDKYTSINKENIKDISLENIEKFKKDLQKKELLKEEIKEGQILKIIYEFIKYRNKIVTTTQNHNTNFYDQETNGYLNKEGIRVDDFLENRKNKEMFSNIVGGETSENPEEYIKEKSFIKSEDLYTTITPELVNKMTFINNLYLKPPTQEVSAINAGNVLETTKESNEYRNYNEQNKQAMRQTIFDHIDEKSEQRKGIYYIQGSSDKMIVNEIQQSILDYDENIQRILNNI